MRGFQSGRGWDPGNRLPASRTHSNGVYYDVVVECQWACGTLVLVKMVDKVNVECRSAALQPERLLTLPSIN